MIQATEIFFHFHIQSCLQKANSNVLLCCPGSQMSVQPSSQRNMLLSVDASAEDGEAVTQHGHSEVKCP
jgi:hypothetical protein